MTAGGRGGLRGGRRAGHGRCILALYRSAAQPAMTEWGDSWRRPSAGRAS